MEKAFGLIQIFYGNGKGKTTAALGQGLRALGHGYNVHLVQFMKSGIKDREEFNEYGELKALKKFENFSLQRFGIKEWVFNQNEEHMKQAKKALEAGKKAVSSGKYDMVILDEVLYAVQLNLLKEEQVLDLIESKSKNTELIMTGSHIPFKRIFEKADLVTEIKKVKHPFDSGIGARKGIEY